MDIDQLNTRFKDKSPKEIIKFAIDLTGISKIALASSLSIEDQILTHMAISTDRKTRIFFIDTGRHFQETYDVMDKTSIKYNFNYEVYAPSSNVIEQVTSKYGSNFFYNGVNERKRCCEIRKVVPLKRVLSTVDAWICGLRKDQSITRGDINIFEWDENNSIYKINPLAFWTEQMVWDYIRENNIPHSDLYDRGFRSVGCQPCTRAVGEHEDIRSGRWWWESPDKKECGLHCKKS